MSLLPLLNKKIVFPYKPLLPEGITSGQLQVLFMISAERPIRMQDLAEHLGVGKQQLNNQIKPLETKGYVLRMTDESNRHIVRADLTERGQKLMEEIDQSLVSQLKPSFDSFSEKEKDEFLRSLEQVKDFMSRL